MHVHIIFELEGLTKTTPFQSDQYSLNLQLLKSPIVWAFLHFYLTFKFSAIHTIIKSSLSSVTKKSIVVNLPKNNEKYT